MLNFVVFSSWNHHETSKKRYKPWPNWQLNVCTSTKWVCPCFLDCHAPWVLSQSSDLQFTNLFKTYFVVSIQKEFHNPISWSWTKCVAGSDRQFSLTILLMCLLQLGFWFSGSSSSYCRFVGYGRHRYEPLLPSGYAVHKRSKAASQC